MTKEDFAISFKEVCAKHTDISVDKEFATICKNASKHGISKEAFSVFAEELLLSRAKCKQYEVSGKNTYAMAFAFIMYIYGASLDTDKLTDAEYLNFQNKMINALSYILTKMQVEHADLDISNTEDMLEVVQECLEDVAANFKPIVDNVSSYALLHPSTSEDDTDKVDE